MDLTLWEVIGFVLLFLMGFAAWLNRALDEYEKKNRDSKS